MQVQALFKVIAEVVGTTFAFLLLWSAAGRLMTSSSDLGVLAGILLIILTLCLLVYAARIIYFHAKEIGNGPQNQ